jgi:hypothetical protein
MPQARWVNVWPAFAAAVILSSAVGARAADVYVTEPHFIDYREVGAGLAATSGDFLDDFKIGWNISYDSVAAVWTYDYTFYSAGKGATNSGISHLDLQVSKGFTIVEILDEDGDNIKDEFDNTEFERKARDGAGGTFDGIKFERNDGEDFRSVTFTTVRSPIWGDFRIKKSPQYVYNTGISTDPTAAPLGLTFDEERTHFLAWLPTPDTISGVVTIPVPLATPIALALITGWGLIRRRRRNGRDMN